MDNTKKKLLLDDKFSQSKTNYTFKIIKKSLYKEPYKLISSFLLMLSFLVSTFFPLFFSDLVDESSSYWIVIALAIIVFLSAFIILLSPALVLYWLISSSTNIHKLFSPNITKKNNNINLLLFWLTPNIITLFFILIVLVHYDYSIMTIFLLHILIATILLIIVHYKSIKSLFIFNTRKNLKILKVTSGILFEYFTLYLLASYPSLFIALILEKSLYFVSQIQSELNNLLLLGIFASCFYFMCTLFFIKPKNEVDKPKRMIYLNMLFIGGIFLISCKFYEPFLKPVLALNHIAYFSDINYVFKKRTCAYLSNNNIKIVYFDGMCSIEGQFEVKSTIGTHSKFTFNTNSLNHIELSIKKSDILFKKHISPKFPEDYEIKRLGKFFMNIDKLPNLVISLFSSNNKKLLSVTNSVTTLKDLDQSLFEMDNTGRAIIIANLIFSIEHLMDLSDNFTINQNSAYSTRMIDLLAIDGIKNQNKHFTIVKKVLENALGKSFEKLHINNRNIFYTKNNTLDNIAPSYILDKNHYKQISPNIYNEKKLLITLPELTKKFNTIANNKHLREQFIFLGYLKKDIFNNQKILYLESNTSRHQVLVVYFIDKKYSIALATNKMDYYLLFSNIFTQRLINSIQIT